MTATQEILAAVNQANGSASSKAFIAAICEGEGGTHWNILFGGSLWTGSLDAFPPWPGVLLSNGQWTHAAGGPQFEPATYADISRVSGRPAFYPQDQIQNCWDLADQVFNAKHPSLMLHWVLETGGATLALIPTYLGKTWPGGADSGFPKRFANNLALVTGPRVSAFGDAAILP